MLFPNTGIIGVSGFGEIDDELETVLFTIVSETAELNDIGWRVMVGIEVVGSVVVNGVVADVVVVAAVVVVGLVSGFIEAESVVVKLKGVTVAVFFGIVTKIVLANGEVDGGGGVLGHGLVGKILSS